MTSLLLHTALGRRTGPAQAARAQVSTIRPERAPTCCPATAAAAERLGLRPPGCGGHRRPASLLVPFELRRGPRARPRPPPARAKHPFHNIPIWAKNKTSATAVVVCSRADPAPSPPPPPALCRTEIDKASWWCGVDKSQKLQALTREEQANVLREVSALFANAKQQPRAVPHHARHPPDQLAKRGISDFGTEDLAMNHSLLQSEAEQTAGSEQKEVYVRHPELL